MTAIVHQIGRSLSSVATYEYLKSTMSPPGSSSPSSSVTSNGSSCKKGVSMCFKAIFCLTLVLITGGSIYVSLNLTSIPDIYSLPEADIPAASLQSQERYLNDKQHLPWKIREPRPWRLRPPQRDVIVRDNDESKRAEPKDGATKEEPKKDTKKNSTSILRIPTKNNRTQPDKLKPVKEMLKESVRAKSDATKKETDNGESEKTSETKKPLNILLLFADDMRHDSIGVASNGLVKTPFFDQLATEGMRFTHNCVTTSVCWVSRATLYTGQYVSRHKSTEPMKPEFYAGWNKTFPYLLREAGYYFGHVGKWHFKDYEEFVKPQLDFERFYYGRHWFEEQGGPIHTTKKNEIDAIQFLKERPKDKPFCLTVCFFTPHAHDGEPEQYLPQNQSMTLYVNDTIPVAPSATDEAWKKMPHFFSEINEGRNRYFWRFDTPEKYQTMMKNYYRLISEIDSTSERIVNELKEQGILDETLIIFTTDNGYFHAEHGLADKFYPYQESIRVPLIVRDPRMQPTKVGKLSDEFTLNIDLAPTILGAAGIPKPDVMQGNDFSPLYTVDGESKRRKWRKEFFYEHPVHLREDIIPASEALVRKDYKFMLWPDFHVEQLFDLKNDTYELNDLINSTNHRDLLQEMRSRFQILKKLAK